MLTSIGSGRTGLKVKVWAKCDDSFGKDSPYMFIQDESTGSSMKIPIGSDGCVVIPESKDFSREVLEEVHRWIALNRDPLLSHWKGEIDSADFVSSILPLQS